jgi:hypothetical protein
MIIVTMGDEEKVGIIKFFKMRRHEFIGTQPWINNDDLIFGSGYSKSGVAQ